MTKGDKSIALKTLSGATYGLAATLCLCGDGAEDFSSCIIYDCLLVHLNNSLDGDVFTLFLVRPIGAELDNLDGCHLHCDQVKKK